MSVNLGYCCINTELSKQNITTNRGMIKKTWLTRGLEYASELALKNSRDLLKILHWNEKNGIKVFRIGSGIFPWATEYDLQDLPDMPEICTALSDAGRFAKENGHRLSAHPDHFVKLGSAKPHVVENSIKELEIHSMVFDLMELYGYETPINIHVGMNFSEEVAERWITAYRKLSHNCAARLVVENDDKQNGFSVIQLFTYLYQQERIPITFDYFHHSFHTDGLSTKDAFYLAYSTWPDFVIPLFHYSESKMLSENVKCNPRAHADYVFNKIDTFGELVDIDLEAKAKELAVKKYMELV